MGLIVQKYGGSSLPDPQHIQAIASKIANLYEQGHQLLIVVSAMGDTTDNLMKLAKKITDHPTRRELDMLLSAGERVSMALMSMSLNDHGTPAISFTGSQAGIFTDGAHSNARITDIKPIRVEQSLKENKVIVLAGFQGVNPTTKEVTTLGRGGSDTTAVAMAHHFKAERCEILKDVNGVCTADPRIVDCTTPLQTLTYDHLANMCFWGSKVLHYRAVELAKSLKVPLFIGSSKDRTKGTEVGPELNSSDKKYETLRFLSVNSHRFVEHLKIQAKDMQEAIETLDKFIRQHDLPAPQILASKQEGDHCRVMITNDQNSLMATTDFIKMGKAKSIEDLNHSLSSVTLTCHQADGTQVAKEVLDQLKTAQITPEKMLNDALSISVFVNSNERERAVQTLHSLLQK